MDHDAGSDPLSSDELGADPALVVSTELSGTSARVVVSGELDLHGTSELVEATQQLLAGRPVTTLVMDLRDVRFVDSAGIQAVLLVRQDAQEAGMAFQLHTSPAVTRLLDLAGLTDELTPDD